MHLKVNRAYIDNANQTTYLKQHIKATLVTYFKQKEYPKELINSIIDDRFISSNPSYYLFYPYLFNKYFDFYDDKVLTLLSISGFLYYRSIILIDDIFDNEKDSNDNFQKFFIINICQEETIKILSSFFNSESDFWLSWNKRKQEYIKAYKLDKTLCDIQDYVQYIELADYKSAFGKIVIDILYHLSGKKNDNVYKTLLESHKFFYTGFQIMDDISDLQEDVENNQFNISIYELKKILNKENESIKVIQ